MDLPDGQWAQSTGQAQDLYARLQLEEKIRDGAENLLHEFEAEPHHKLKPRPTNYKKQVLAQLKTATSNIGLLREQLRSLDPAPDQVLPAPRGSFESEHEPDPRERSASMISSASRSRAESVGLVPPGLSGLLPTSISSPQGPMSAGQISSGGSGTGLLPSPSTSSFSQAAPPSPQGPLSADPEIHDAGALFASLFDSMDPRDDPHVTISRIHQLSQLLAEHPLLRTDFAMGQIYEKLRPFLSSSQSQVLGIGYRLIRLVFTSVSSIATLRHSLCLDQLIMRSFSRSDGPANDTERWQALLLLRTWMGIPGGIGEITNGLVRALVAVVEHSEGRFKELSAETLAELTVLDASKAFSCGALPILLKLMSEGPANLAVPLAMNMVNILDHPNTRKDIRNGVDLSELNTVFTEPLNSSSGSGSGPNPSSDRLRVAGASIVTILRSWAGIHSFDTKTLVDCLVIPKRVIQETLLDIFSVALGSTNNKYDTSAFSKRLTAVLLQKLVGDGLVEKLMHIQAPGTHRAVKEKAHLLLGHMSTLTSELVPKELVLKTVDISAQFSDDLLEKPPRAQLPALTLPIFQLSSAIRGPSASKVYQVQYHDDLLASYGVAAMPQSAQVWAKVGSQMDEASFKQLVNATHVLTTKTFTRWNWDVLLELIQGPLHNPKRLDEAIRATKFMKRLVSFYRPFKYRFSSIKKSKQNQKYVHVGKELISTLLATPEGVRYLTGNKLLRQIGECLAQLDPASGITSVDEPLFSGQRLRNTLSYGYFEFLGMLSRSAPGQQMLSQLRVWNMFYNIADTDRDDVMRLFISSMDYTQNGHARLILSKSLTVGTQAVKLFAIEYLQILTVAKPISGAQIAQQQKKDLWAVDLLVTQLFDPDIEVCRMTVQSLLVFCQNEENLDHLISLRPNIAHLGSLGGPLYMLFLSKSTGFDYLSNIDFIHAEMDHWVHGFNEKHVAQIEEFLHVEGSRAVQSWFDLISSTSMPAYDSTMSESLHHWTPAPRHFFGDLVLTTEGTKLLQDRGYVETFGNFIKANLSPVDPEDVIKLKGCLWAIGHITSKPLGASLITIDLVEAICVVYARAEVYSVRGTAFNAIGLIASSFEGAELLYQCGWGSKPQTSEHLVSVALIVDQTMMDEVLSRYPEPVDRKVSKVDQNPNHPKGELSAPPSNGSGTTSRARSRSASISGALDPLSIPAVPASGGTPVPSIDEHDFDFVERPPVRMSSMHSMDSAGRRLSNDEVDFPRKYDAHAQSVLNAISDLSNHLLASEASKQLVALRTAKPGLFQSVDLFKDSIELMAKFHFKQLVRRFIFDIFDTASILDRQMRRRGHKPSLRPA